MRTNAHLAIVVFSFIGFLLSYALNSEAGSPLKCYDCHGTRGTEDIRPVDSSFRNPSTGGIQGNHRNHLGYGATSNSCQKCHPGSAGYVSGHRDGKISLSGNINSSVHPAKARYENSSSSGYNNYTSFPQSSDKTGRYSLGSCNNVNCHFEKTTPEWGSPALEKTAGNCNTCHGAPPSDGQHPSSVDGPGKKHGNYLGTDINSCSYCHADHRTEFAHATSAGKRPLIVGFTRFPNNSTSSSYSGDVTYPNYLPSQNPVRNGSCNNTYCHSNGRKDISGNAGAPNMAVTWSSGQTTKCFSCHNGLSTNPDPNLAPAQTTSSTEANCNAISGAWSSAKGYCTPDLVMSSNGHHRLVGQQWVRKYPCYYCHNATINPDGTLKDRSKHLNKTVDIEMAAKWKIGSRPDPSYDRATKVCANVYCHSDGTVNPEAVRPFAWTEPKTQCNTCHGHPTGSCSNAGCHDGKIHADDPTNKLWTLPETFGNSSSYRWPAGQEWKNALPMYANNPAANRPNSHQRHAQTDFTCDNCHNETVLNGSCTDCHKGGTPTGVMSEVSHINAAVHVNKVKNVKFKNVEASYINRTCSNTLCHRDSNPVWGSKINDVKCFSCHGDVADKDDFGSFNGIQAKINMTQWEVTGHGRGRYSLGNHTSAYPVSGNPAANFPGNPCWYCHDNSVIHKDPKNPFRLKMHNQYSQRFEKECVYCHMEGTVTECLSCHVGQTESLSPQATSGGIKYKYKFNNLSTRIDHTDHTYTTNCINGGGACHPDDSKTHKTNAGVWTKDMKADIRNQYLMMGVCLQCHDDDSSNQCTNCHVSPSNNPNKYSLGYDPGTGFIKPKKARASAGHFGHKHYQDFKDSGGWLKHYTSVKSPIFGTYSVVNGTWKGGKFCWDCHDPHGDSNIYMIQKEVATTTDGIFGIPRTRKAVNFNVTLGETITGANYVKKTGATTIDGICNVCHAPPPQGRHYTQSSGDSHNSSRRCTECHAHRFADSHANKQACNSCHSNYKPIPKHTAFGLPRDCTKCHSGTIGKRMDIMGQMKANSHHVQGVVVNNRHCYACHWEATAEGLIDNQRHAGFNYKNYSSVKNGAVDLVIWKANGVRPTFYSSTSATTFTANNIARDGDLQRTEIGKITNHCLSCHSDQNNDSEPFGDSKTPRQYAWDLQSIAARYSQTGTTTWGKYASTPNAAQKNIVKAFSAHGNAVANGGGWDTTTGKGLDGVITNTRGGTSNVQCFDCHNSHGSKTVGTTSSYTTFNGSNNGANLKETGAGFGGYSKAYKASANVSGVNPYGAGAGQCFDCHESATSGTSVANGYYTPWGYSSTFGATEKIMGYKDTPRFGQNVKASTARFAYRDSRKTILGGHLKASEPSGSLSNLAKDSGSFSGGSKTSLTDGSKNWSPDKWKNQYVQIGGSGANNGQLRKITGNTSNTLTFEAFNTGVDSGSYKIVPYSTTMKGLCTPCHDPHGVSPTLGEDKAFAVPLLKGTWMTSPYKEDAPPPDPYGPEATAKSWSKYTGEYKSGMYTRSGGVQPETKHTIDRNTFGTVGSVATGAAKRITEGDSKFAGLCLNCHKKINLTNGVNQNDGAAGFKTLDRIHEAVKGWGVNTEHSFTCSKCHQPHNSGLPRLMQTNCLDSKHRGGKVSGGIPWGVDKQRSPWPNDYYEQRTKGQNGREHRGYPMGSIYGVRDGTNYYDVGHGPEATTACHVSRFKPTYSIWPNTMTNWPDGNYWNNITPW